MTAEECALDMVAMRIKDVPELARKYAERLFSRSAACMEVLIAAYTTYAIIVEGLPSDPGFLIPTEDELWFREQLEEMPKKTSNSTTGAVVYGCQRRKQLYPKTMLPKTP